MISMTADALKYLKRDNDTAIIARSVDHPHNKPRRNDNSQNDIVTHQIDRCEEIF